MTESDDTHESTAGINFIWLCRRSNWLDKVDILATTNIPDIEKTKLLDKLEDIVNGI